jgi:ribosomal protein L40E
MKTCLTCESVNTEEARFCRSCGNAVTSTSTSAFTADCPLCGNTFTEPDAYRAHLDEAHPLPPKVPVEPVAVTMAPDARAEAPGSSAHRQRRGLVVLAAATQPVDQRAHPLDGHLLTPSIPDEPSTMATSPDARAGVFEPPVLTSDSDAVVTSEILNLRCSACGSENPASAEHCIRCWTGLNEPAPPSAVTADRTSGMRICRACDAKNPPEAAHCGDCWEDLDSAAISGSAGAEGSSMYVGPVGGTHGAKPAVAVSSTTTAPLSARAEQSGMQPTPLPAPARSHPAVALAIVLVVVCVAAVALLGGIMVSNHGSSVPAATTTGGASSASSGSSASATTGTGGGSSVSSGKTCAQWQTNYRSQYVPGPQAPNEADYYNEPQIYGGHFTQVPSGQTCVRWIPAGD